MARFSSSQRNRNVTCYGKNLSSKQYASGTRKDRSSDDESRNNYNRPLGDKMNAPADRNPPRPKDAGARKEARFTGNDSEGREYGGSHGDGLFDPRPVELGLGGKIGTNSHHGSAKSDSNTKPKNAHDFSDFSNVGGTSNKPTLG